MTLAEIENLSFADLKASRTELIAAARKSSAEDLATRYIQARTDARHRDERMAEMGREATQLQQSLEVERTAHEATKVAAQSQIAELESGLAEAVKANAAMEVRIEAYKAEIANRG